MCHIILKDLFVLIVDVWTLKYVNWLNLLVKAMNELMITIMENNNTRCYGDIKSLQLKLYGVGK